MNGRAVAVEPAAIQDFDKGYVLSYLSLSQLLAFSPTLAAKM